MITFHSQATHHIVISRKEGRYMTRGQAIRAVQGLDFVLELTSSQCDDAQDFLCGKFPLVDFEDAWTGTPATLQAIFGFARWFSLSPENGTHTLKKAFVLVDCNGGPLSDRSVVYTTRRISFLSPVTKDLASRGYATRICTEMYRCEMAMQYPKGYMHLY